MSIIQLLPIDLIGVTFSKLSNDTKVHITTYLLEEQPYVLDELYKAAQSFNIHVFKLAASYNKLEVIKWFHEHGYYGDRHALYWAIYEGHYDVVEWLTANEYYGRDARHHAVKYGRVDMLKLFHITPYYVNTLHYQSVYSAISYNQLPILKWLYSVGYKPTVEYIQLAVMKGYLEIVKWLHTVLSLDNIKWHNSILVQLALNNNQLPVAKWLYHVGHKVNFTCLSVARETNNTRAIEWLKNIEITTGHRLSV
jgi:uncharacterized pyridoxamine 5'-phosphate oxidase family protein